MENGGKKFIEFTFWRAIGKYPTKIEITTQDLNDSAEMEGIPESESFSEEMFFWNKPINNIPSQSATIVMKIRPHLMYQEFISETAGLVLKAIRREYPEWRGKKVSAMWYSEVLCTQFFCLCLVVLNSNSLEEFKVWLKNVPWRRLCKMPEAHKLKMFKFLIMRNLLKWWVASKIFV